MHSLGHVARNSVLTSASLSPGLLPRSPESVVKVLIVERFYDIAFSHKVEED